LAFVFTFQAQTFAVDFSVNLTGDAGDFTCDATCTLRDAIDDANAAVTDDTISFAAGITNITLSTNQIDINNAGTLTINGSGANVLTIDGGAGMNRIFLVNSATVTIRGVTLTGGNGNGAAVRVNDGTLILEAVVVQNNVGDSQEGAVFYGGGTNHRIANSTFSGNTDFGACSAFRALGASLTVFNTTVSGNSTTRGIGAICFLGNSTATFRNTTISDNIADGTDGGGGGIFIQDTATVIWAIRLSLEIFPAAAVPICIDLPARQFLQHRAVILSATSAATRMLQTPQLFRIMPIFQPVPRTPTATKWA
jgi:hypothetical protein